MLAVIVNEIQPVNQPITFEYMCPVKRADVMQSVAEEFGVVIDEKVLREGESFYPTAHAEKLMIVPESSVFLKFSQTNSYSTADFWQRVKEIEDSKINP